MNLFKKNYFNYKLFVTVILFILIILTKNPHQISADVPQHTNIELTKITEQSSSYTFENKAPMIGAVTSESILREYLNSRVKHLAQKKLIALTFDDGPHKTLTPQLLKILKKEKVTATFFVVGDNVKLHPNILKQIDTDGHQIGSHSMSHKNLTKLKKAERKVEIEDMNTLVDKIIGSPPTALRPPYGAYNETIKKQTELPIVLWSVDPEDWKYKNADTVYKHVVSNIRDGDIVLLHDIHKTSVIAAEKIIKKLKKEGYTFVTVDELIDSRGSASKGNVYSSIRPPK